MDGNKPGLENPRIPEGINASSEHPLKEFFWLLAGVGICIALVIGGLSLSAGWLAKYIPFEYEEQLADRFIPADSHDDEIEDWLQRLAGKLVDTRKLPDAIPVKVHYSDSDVVNAFATIGGHIFIFRGLIEALPSEDALAMVIAHEIAHIQHRHPVRALGRGVTIGVALSAVLGVSGSTAGETILGELGLLTALSFSRSQEYAADTAALASLVGVYGHGKGARELFDVFKNLEAQTLRVPEISSTHPHSSERLGRINEIAENNGWEMDGSSSPMPEIFPNQ